MPPSEDRPRIRPTGAVLYFVHCPKCDRVIGEVKPVPGFMSRYKCRSCGEWTVLLCVEPEPVD